MSTTKEMIEFLDELIDKFQKNLTRVISLHVPKCGFDLTDSINRLKKKTTCLTEIRRIVEYYEKSEHFTKVYLPIPKDEKLDEELAIGDVRLNIVDCFRCVGDAWLDVDYEDLDKEIRSLLQFGGKR